MMLLSGKTSPVVKISEVGVSAGLLGWWPLSGHLRNQVTPKHDGVQIGALNELISPAGIGLKFDGVTAAIEIPTTPDYDVEEVTLAAWVMLESLDNWKRIIMRGSHDNYQMDINPTNRRVRIVIWTTTTTTTAVQGYSQTALQNNRWYHCVCTAGGGVQRMYIDGVLEGQLEYTGTLAPRGSQPIRIGDDSRGGYVTTQLHGGIADARIYDGALTPAEVKLLYELTRSQGKVVQANDVAYVGSYHESL